MTTEEGDNGEVLLPESVPATFTDDGIYVVGASSDSDSRKEASIVVYPVSRLAADDELRVLDVINSVEIDLDEIDCTIPREAIARSIVALLLSGYRVTVSGHSCDGHRPDILTAARNARLLIRFGETEH